MEWFRVNVEPVNKMLREAIEVYDSVSTTNDIHWLTKNQTNYIHTNKAYLINIQPIVKQTREQRLEGELDRLIKLWNNTKFETDFNEEFERAEAILDE